MQVFDKIRTPNLARYLREYNQWSRYTGKPQLTLDDVAELAELIDLDLSPENLTCDGELAPSQVQSRYRYLTACAREILALDPRITFCEL